LFGQVLFHDGFDGTGLDSKQWLVGQWGQQRTMLDQAPTIANGMATLRLNTFDVGTPGLLFSGSEIFTQSAFPVGNGLEMQARVRMNALPDGIVTSFFADNFQPNDNNETDFEALSSQYHQAAPAGSSLLLSTWHHWGAPDSHYFDQVHHADRAVTVPNFDPSQFNTLTIQYYPDMTRWLVNGQTVWQTTAAHPEGPMHVHFNIWAAGPQWAKAYSPTLLTTVDPLFDRSFTYDIDSVTVTALPPPIPGDTNRDGLVNLQDVLTLAQHFRDAGTTWASGDFNGDGQTNIWDLTILAQHASPSHPLTAAAAAVTVPEPASVLAVPAAALLCARRRRCFARESRLGAWV
jgi:hypothetical protein